MNTDIFEIHRFGKYLRYDIRHFLSSYGLNLAVISVIPLWGFLVRFIYCRLSGTILQPESLFPPFTYAVSYAIVTIFFGTKVYGKLTEKRNLSFWIMIPASRLEKFLSMMTIACIVTPVLYIVIFGVADSLMGLVPGYGKTVLSVKDEMLIDSGFSSTLPLALIQWGNWCIGILVFNLGAIYFKKNKISKTLLVLMLAGLVFTLAAICIVRDDALGLRCRIISMFEGISPEDVARMAKLLLWASYILIISLLGFATYKRIKRFQA